MDKIKISAVSFINSYPFIYGLESLGMENKIEIFKDTPAECANKLINDEVDIGLIPISEIPKLKYHKVITRYCLGAKFNVRTVLLISQYPLNEIKKIFLDKQSRTSNKLVQILSDKFWNISPSFENPANNAKDIDFKENIGMVVIGDKAFGIENKYNYKYDLADEWFNFTNLPFVFACWVANKSIDYQLIDKIDKALGFGLENIPHLIESNYNGVKSIENIENYYKNNIDYILDEKKKNAMQLFLKLLGEVS